MRTLTLRFEQFPKPHFVAHSARGSTVLVGTPETVQALMGARRVSDGELAVFLRDTRSEPLVGMLVSAGFVHPEPPSETLKFFRALEAGGVRRLYTCVGPGSTSELADLGFNSLGVASGNLVTRAEEPQMSRRVYGFPELATDLLGVMQRAKLPTEPTFQYLAETSNGVQEWPPELRRVLLEQSGAHLYPESRARSYARLVELCLIASEHGVK